ncbi:MAG: hypothetical protein QOJ63_2561 [Solirubrobacteraceae bacterium]|jgi:hypothetical protein|nr:hypothetical protein [Solirubrobacteraceae bacterium]
MRRLLAIALPAVLLLAAPAVAKEVTGAKVCGADGCRSMPGAGASLLGGGPPRGGPAAAEPFVRVEFSFRGHPQPVRNVFLPRSGLLLADDGTTWMHPLALAELRRQARRVTPFAASELPAPGPAPGGAAPARAAAGPASASAPPTAAAPPAPAPDAGWEAWWPVLPTAVLALVGGASLARRRRRDRLRGAAGAT